ncbi:MAG: hypothetical protein NTV33_07660 [Coprothermobacterota bacterium]|nr:hypothetical protein [Coprothermobacterota bacterium]
MKKNQDENTAEIISVLGAAGDLDDALAEKVEEGVVDRRRQRSVGRLGNRR